MPSNRTSTKGGFYAVRKGKVPGIYTTWAECEAQIKGFPDARYKKFPHRGLAQDFVAGVESTESTGPSTGKIEDAKGKKRAFDEVEDESAWDVVYSDGACKGNGKVGSVAGVGVWWGLGDARNIAERCPGDQTNNRAELIAILRVFETTPVGKKPLLIKTDSQYSISCFRDWIKKWSAKGWRTTQGEPVKNAGIIRCIAKHLEIRAKNGQKLSIQYVKGHSGDVGNDGADTMANQGARLPAVAERNWEILLEELDRQLSKTGLLNEADVAPVEIQGPDGVVEPVELPTKMRKVMKHSEATSTSHSTSETEDRTTAHASKSTSSSVSSVKQATTVPLQGPQPLPDRNSERYNWPKSPLKVLCAVPPLVPVRAEEVNVDDYADCILDDADLADELSD